MTTRTSALKNGAAGAQKHDENTGYRTRGRQLRLATNPPLYRLDQLSTKFFSAKPTSSDPHLCASIEFNACSFCSSLCLLQFAAVRIEKGVVRIRTSKNESV